MQGHMRFAPGWVKKNPKRFQRVVTMPAPGAVSKVMDVLSCLSPESIEADAKVFAALMGHLKGVETEYPVIIVQAETRRKRGSRWSCPIESRTTAGPHSHQRPQPHPPLRCHGLKDLARSSVQVLSGPLSPGVAPARFNNSIVARLVFT